MNKAMSAAEVEALVREIQRYLAYVEASRAAGPLPPFPKQGEGDKNA